jgi:hypothetical protein
MKEDIYIPSVVDFAYEVIDMHREIIELRRQVDHYKKLDEIHRDSLKNIDKHQKESLGIVLGAVLDPDSALNRGHVALLEKEAMEGTP